MLLGPPGQREPGIASRDRRRLSLSLSRLVFFIFPLFYLPLFIVDRSSPIPAPSSRWVPRFITRLATGLLRGVRYLNFQSSNLHFYPVSCSSLARAVGKTESHNRDCQIWYLINCTFLGSKSAPRVLPTPPPASMQAVWHGIAGSSALQMNNL